MKCQCCAYGWVSTVGALATFTAFIMMWVGAFKCDMVIVDDYEFDGRTFDLGLGVFTLSQTGDRIIENPVISEQQYDGYNCLSYSDSKFISVGDLDAAITSARVFGGIAVGFSWPLLFATWALLCCAPEIEPSKGNMMILRYAMMASCFTMGLFTLLMLAALGTSYCDEGSGCHAGPMSTVTIIASIIWFITGCLYLGIQKPDLYGSNRLYPSSTSGQGTQSYPQVEMSTLPDGTRVTRRVVHNPDGSQTVTETRVTPGQSQVSNQLPSRLQPPQATAQAVNVTVEDGDDVPIVYADVVKGEK